MTATPHLSDAHLQLLAGHPSLPPPAAAHLAACPACQARLADYQHLIRALAALPSLAPAPGLAAQVLARLPPPVPARRAASHYAGPALAGLFVLALLGVVAGYCWPLLHLMARTLPSAMVVVLAGTAGLLLLGRGLELAKSYREKMQQLAVF